MVTRKQAVDLVFDIQKVNASKLSDDNTMCTFSEVLYDNVESIKGIKATKFTWTADHVDINVENKEKVGGKEKDQIVVAVVDSLLEINADSLELVKRSNNLTNDEMINLVKNSIDVLDMSQPDRKVRTYRVNLHV